MGKTYKLRPSKILNIENDYEAFCFDEACDYILYELTQEKPKDPKWLEIQEKENKQSKDNKATIEWMMKHSKPI